MTVSLLQAKQRRETMQSSGGVQPVLLDVPRLSSQKRLILGIVVIACTLAFLLFKNTELTESAFPSNATPEQQLVPTIVSAESTSHLVPDANTTEKSPPSESNEKSLDKTVSQGNQQVADSRTTVEEKLSGEKSAITSQLTSKTKPIEKEKLRTIKITRHQSSDIDKAKREIKKGNFRSALAHIKRAEDFEYDIDAQVVVATAYVNLKQYHEAKTVYLNLLEKQPLNKTWWLGLAYVLEQLNNKAQSIHAYTQALRLDTERSLPVKSIQRKIRMLKQGES